MPFARGGVPSVGLRADLDLDVAPVEAADFDLRAALDTVFDACSPESGGIPEVRVVPEAGAVVGREARSSTFATIACSWPSIAPRR